MYHTQSLGSIKSQSNMSWLQYAIHGPLDSVTAHHSRQTKGNPSTTNKMTAEGLSDRPIPLMV